MKIEQTIEDYAKLQESFLAERVQKYVENGDPINTEEEEMYVWVKRDKESGLRAETVNKSMHDVYLQGTLNNSTLEAQFVKTIRVIVDSTNKKPIAKKLPQFYNY